MHVRPRENPSLLTPAPDDLLGEEGGRWFPEHLRETAANLLARQGGVATMAILIARRNPKTRLSFAKPQLIPVVLSATSEASYNAAKETMADEVRKLCRRVQAAGAGTVSEAWGAPQTPEEYHRDGWRGRLGEHPGRVEMMVATWQHRAVGMGGSWAPIIRDPGEPPRLGPWEPLPIEGGLMVEFLPEGEQ